MRRGFTLIELAVVLTIIGLIIGGVIVGQDLIVAAQVNSVFSDFRKFQSAVNAFRDKYQYPPGDMPNATAFWGVLAGTGSDATCQNTPATGTATCNGNGDGQVLTSVVSGDEVYRFWQHLANAGLVEGQYIGTPATNAGYSTAIIHGVNFPPMKLGNMAVWEAVWWGYVNSSTTDFGMNYGNILLATGAGSGPPLTVMQAYQVDRKFDDGLPGSGMIIARKQNPTTSPCTSAAGNMSDAGATYNLAHTGPACMLVFPKAF